MNNTTHSDKKYNSLLRPAFQGISPNPRGRILIAGPCSAESRQQVLASASGIAALGPGIIFRAGAWKPRTSPGCFEGVGAEALKWIAEAGHITGMPVATEVATPDHVYLAFEAGIDIFWIGARTAANPFAVQALAETIGRVCPDKTVLVKNPVSPDPELWIGALARLLSQGVTHLGAIHRGFSVYRSQPFRNSPIWQIPMEMHRRLPDLPILHDPSHTGGKREHIATLSQQALDIGFSGLMIECHTEPEKALSDGGQQITPLVLKELWNSLKIRNANIPDSKLNELRWRIDELDSELLDILCRRMTVSRDIGAYKLEHDMPVMQPDRYNRLLTALLEQGCKMGLDEKFLTDLLERIHAESVRCQLDMMDHPATEF